MPVVNMRHITPIHWIPPVNSPTYKVVIITKGGSTHDLTEQFVSNTVEDDCTDSIGRFDIIKQRDLFWNDIFSSGDSLLLQRLCLNCHYVAVWRVC
ncbi:hypothetical protein CCP3SC5AM1_1750008 [Gammaproteobacteria bacterium]